ncbi:MAG: glycosyl transferase [Myxococcaceae bacterium]|nr:glycosyl transferase [Myxococcaceae bacterium]
MNRQVALLLSLACLALTGWLSVFWHEPLPDVLRTGRGELALSDARRALLREAAGKDGLRAEWVPLADVPPAALSALIESEDHRLFAHHGVDPLGLARALFLDLRARRLVAGGSTLAMQLARLSYDLPRTAPGKLEQALRGLVLQARLGPAGVLEAYVNLAPFGRDVRGIAEASRVYFGKPLRDLTRGEAVALACLPRAPSGYDPERHGARLLRRRAQVLSLLERRQLLSAAERAELAAEPLSLVRFARPFRAPHATELARREALQRGAGEASSIRTTIDPTLQRAAEWACERAATELRDEAATGCAAVVLRVSTAEVLALVGSPSFHDAPAGQVDAALMPRQPGSALKPFVYALAFEQGRTPDSHIVDEPAAFPAQFGAWLPENYDRRFHGEVTLREALACSYNVPAAKLAASLGTARVLARLRSLGLSTLEKGAEHYGVGIALGVGEVTLLELTAAYATLARGGEYVAPTLLAEVDLRGHNLPLRERRRARVFSPEVSAQITDVLSDARARSPAFGAGSVLELPFPAAVKTGTSSHYRDNWTLGYAGDSAVGIWIGRHDGAPMHGISGVSGAGPAFRHLLLTAEGKRRGRERELVATGAQVR